VCATISPVSVGSSFAVEVCEARYCVVLSPCCSIGHETILLSPLIKLLPAFYANPHFVEDLTRINRTVAPELIFAPHIWAQMPDEKQQRLLGKGMSYTYLDFFIYEGHGLLPNYTVHRKGGDNIQTTCHMVDFRNVHKIRSNKIKSASDSPADMKILELSIGTRQDLRQKLTQYYARVPEEELIALP